MYGLPAAHGRSWERIHLNVREVGKRGRRPSTPQHDLSCKADAGQVQQRCSGSGWDDTVQGLRAVCSSPYLGNCHWAQHPERSSLPGESAAERHRQRGMRRPDPEVSATVEEFVPCDDPAFITSPSCSWIWFSQASLHMQHVQHSRDPACSGLLSGLFFRQGC